MFAKNITHFCKQHFGVNIRFPERKLFFCSYGNHTDLTDVGLAVVVDVGNANDASGDFRNDSHVNVLLKMLMVIGHTWIVDNVHVVKLAYYYMHLQCLFFQVLPSTSFSLHLNWFLQLQWLLSATKFGKSESGIWVKNKCLEKKWYGEVCQSEENLLLYYKRSS